MSSTMPDSSSKIEKDQGTYSCNCKHHYTNTLTNVWPFAEFLAIAYESGV